MKFYKKLARLGQISLLACLALSSSALAANGMKQPATGAAKYDQMDINKDGRVILEEFRTAFPNMNESAFAVIDLNGNGAIEREEWLQFTEGHARGDVPGMREKGAPMNNIPGDPLIPPPDSSDLPLMRPPMQ